MNTFIHPSKEKWTEILKRPYADQGNIVQDVQHILDEVKKNGDEAVRTFARKFDGVEVGDLLVREEEIQNAGTKLPEKLKIAIRQANKNIIKFHKAQVITEDKIETMSGVMCWRKSVPIEKVGLYIPGGTAPLFSTVLMLATPAQLAGCKEVILCTPCSKDETIHPAILFAAQLAGVNKIFKTGGAQAIAAMAYGTESIPAVYKIFGPGNQYVTTAKQLVQQSGIAIDMPAGPSEVCVLADETADPAFIAADLLSQAEHGKDSQVVLITFSSSLLENVNKELENQLADLPRRNIAEKSLENSLAIEVKTIDEAIELLNLYAAEHLIICCRNADEVSEKVINAGSVFIGNYSPESAGDYASGTNHTLPTNGFARAYSGVSIDSFIKKITFQKLSETGLKNIGTTIIEMAEAEGLWAHGNAIRIRNEKLSSR
ncbi:MAG: histidinol dehydrogenase [Flavisolibacter sp.]